MLLVVITGLSLALGAAGPSPQQLGKRIQHTGGLNQKRELGRRLGQNHSPAARAVLLQLLEDEHYWNRLAAVEGLMPWAQPDTDRVLLERMLQDHMIASDVERGFRQRRAAPAAALAGVYARATASERDKLLDLMKDMKDPDVDALLHRVVADASGSPKERAAALKALSGSADRISRHQVLQLLEDPDLADAALAWLAEYGTTEDLPRFRTALADQRTHNAAALAAMAGMARLASRDEQVGVFDEALRSNNAARVQGALAAFARVHHPHLLGALCQVATAGSHQHLRMGAALHLADKPDRNAIACMIPSLREEYHANARQPIEAVPAFLTLGLTTLFSALGERSSKAAFSRRKQQIGQGLQKASGVRLEASYTAWRDWAVSQGMTVDGQNLAMVLLSSRKAERARAREEAARLLGARSVAAWARAHRVNSDGQALTLALVAALMDRGVVMEDAP